MNTDVGNDTRMFESQSALEAYVGKLMNGNGLQIKENSIESKENGDDDEV